MPHPDTPALRDFLAERRHGHLAYRRPYLGWGVFVLRPLTWNLPVYVVLSVTHRVAVTGFDGLPIGLALAAVHLVGIPLVGGAVAAGAHLLTHPRPDTVPAPAPAAEQVRA